MTETETATERPTLLDAIAEGMGIERDQVRAAAQLARWLPNKFREEMRTNGWQDRFREATEAGIQSRAGERARKTLTRDLAERGPASMLKLDLAERVAIVDRRLRKTAEHYTPRTDGSRLLCGPTAAGKSMTCICVAERTLTALYAEGIRRNAGGEAACIWEALMESRPKAVVWVRAADLPVARLQAKLGDGEADLVRHAMRADFLVLDDLGWESRRAGADDVLGEVVQSRYDAGKPTLTTTGLRLQEVIERYGEAFVRRLTECGGKKGIVVDLWGTGASK